MDADVGVEPDTSRADTVSDVGPELLGDADADALPDIDVPEADGAADVVTDTRIEVVPPEETAQSESFGLGVTSGDTSSSDVVIWTRYDGTERLRLVVWQMEGDTYVRPAHDADVVPADGGFVHVLVSGLVAGAHYRYALFEMSGDTRVRRSPIGRFRCAIAEDATEVVTIGVTSCALNGREFSVLSRAAERDDLDLFVLLGDTTYADAGRDVSSYRALWAENLSTAEFRSVRQSTSLLCTWDDHEVEDDWTPESVDPTRLAAARQVFFENQPLRRDLDLPNRVYKSRRWGRTVEAFVLDCRSERQPAISQFISPEQMEWLKSGLLASPAHFKLIFTSVPITKFPNYVFGDDDRWESSMYGPQRVEILSFIDSNAIPGVVWVAGDMHMGCAGRVADEGPGSEQLELLAGPINHDGGFLGLPLPLLDQFDWTTGDNNYAAIRLDPASGDLRVSFHGEDGAVLHDRSYRP